MTNFKIVVSDPKSRKGYQKEVDQNASGLKGKKIGNKVSGNIMGLQGYELEITGGSDSDGFPMRADVDGAVRKKILLTKGVGFKSKIKGKRKRKSVRGNTISADIAQVNTKVIKYGNQPIDKLLGAKEEKKEEAPKEEAKAEKPAEEQKAEEPKKEEAKPEEKRPEEKTTEEKKPEEKMGVKELDKTEEKKEDAK